MSINEKKLEQERLRVSKNVGSIERLCKEAICTTNLELMLALGFPEDSSKELCRIVRKRALELGIKDLNAHYKRSVEEGKSNIINTIVRHFHKVYFASRSNLHPIDLLSHLESKSNDLCWYLVNHSKEISEENRKNRRNLLLAKKLEQKLRESHLEDSPDMELEVGDEQC